MTNFTFNEVSSLGDAHKSYMYQIIIAPLPGTGAVDERVLSMRNTEATLPEEGNADITYDMGGYRFHESGLSAVDGSFNLSWIESMNVGVRSRLESWLELGNQRETNIQQYKSTYQTTGELRLHDGLHSTVYVGTFYGLWLTKLASNSFKNRGTDVTRLTATFTYDLWKSDKI